MQRQRTSNTGTLMRLPFPMPLATLKSNMQQGSTELYIVEDHCIYCRQIKYGLQQVKNNFKLLWFSLGFLFRHRNCSRWIQSLKGQTCCKAGTESHGPGICFLMVSESMCRTAGLPGWNIFSHRWSGFFIFKAQSTGYHQGQTGIPGWTSSRPCLFMLKVPGAHGHNRHRIL